jgi:hypothetical protein
VSLRATSTVVLALLLLACGSSAREKTLRAQLVVLNEARDRFAAIDETAQMRIVEHAPSLEVGRASLSAYRLKRDVVLRAYENAYRMLAAAATGSAAIADVLGAVERISDAVVEMDGGK